MSPMYSHWCIYCIYILCIYTVKKLTEKFRYICLLLIASGGTRGFQGWEKKRRDEERLEKGPASLALELLSKWARKLTKGCCGNLEFRDGMWEATKVHPVVVLPLMYSCWVLVCLYGKAAWCLKSKCCLLIIQRVSDVCGPGRRSNLFQKNAACGNLQVVPCFVCLMFIVVSLEKFLTFPWKYVNVNQAIIYISPSQVSELAYAPNVYLAGEDKLT